jgi:hypothetical protein
MVQTWRAAVPRIRSAMSPYVFNGCPAESSRTKRLHKIRSVYPAKIPTRIIIVPCSIKDMMPLEIIIRKIQMLRRVGTWYLEPNQSEK